MPIRTYNQSIKYFLKVMKIYSISRILLQTVLMDMGFEKTIDDLVYNSVVNTFATK